MATEVTEFAIGVTGEDFATIATEEFDGGFGRTRSGFGESDHDRFGGWIMSMSWVKERTEEGVVDFGMAPSNLFVLPFVPYL